MKGAGLIGLVEVHELMLQRQVHFISHYQADIQAIHCNRLRLVCRGLICTVAMVAFNCMALCTTGRYKNGEQLSTAVVVETMVQHCKDTLLCGQFSSLSIRQ